MEFIELKSSLYDSNFTLYRLSPLHFPSSAPFLSESTLHTHAHRFAGVLKQDVLRGVNVSFENKRENPRHGRFLQSQWSLIRSSDDSSSSTSLQSSGVRIELKYEKLAYKALMIRHQVLHSDSATDELHLPLLLTQMPSSLREILLEYLATAFDTHAEPMRLSSRFLGQSMDDLFEISLQHGHDQSKSMIRDVQFTLGFKSPIAPSLRNLDITIKRDDILSFLKEGKKLEEKAGSSKLILTRSSGPFMVALSHYLRTHLAMDLSHDQIHVSKASCGSFALAREGRVKVKRPMATSSLEDGSGDSNSDQRAVSNLIDQLLKEATNREK
ncbi:hypothetical protein MMC14_000120 [Varicellaria rhodocarpa]|nr:hypothetical protein [Varicellaria rhodocarpa]